jgi:hypothetical protein
VRAARRGRVLQCRRDLHHERQRHVLLLPRGVDALWLGLLRGGRGVRRQNQGDVRMSGGHDALWKRREPHLLSGRDGVRLRRLWGAGWEQGAGHLPGRSRERRAPQAQHRPGELVDDMSERFEDLTRRLAKPLPRRRALRMFGAATLAGVAAAVVRPLRGDAQPQSCPSGTKECATPALCCSPGQTCTQASGIACCCPAGATPCGLTCCEAGVACLDRNRGFCGCPAGTTRCGPVGSHSCCPAATGCSDLAACSPPPNTKVAATCMNVFQSDVRLKRTIVPVDW